jgi:hypothetical protein
VPRTRAVAAIGGCVPDCPSGKPQKLNRVAGINLICSHKI